MSGERFNRGYTGKSPNYPGHYSVHNADSLYCKQVCNVAVLTTEPWDLRSVPPCCAWEEKVHILEYPFTNLFNSLLLYMNTPPRMNLDSSWVAAGHSQGVAHYNTCSITVMCIVHITSIIRKWELIMEHVWYSIGGYFIEIPKFNVP